MKVITIGDIHGESVIWKIADLKKLLESSKEIPQYDAYIFLGDYVDSHTLQTPKIISNFKKIIQLKQNYPYNIVLLLGNHDLAYLLGHFLFPCSGHDRNYDKEIQKLFLDNIELFCPIYQLDNYIFTHAGISQKWLDKFKFIHGIKTPSIPVKTINNCFFKAISDKNHINVSDPIFDCGMIRGGENLVGGIFWADFRETFKDIVPGYKQIVGHTPVKKIVTLDNKKEGDSFGSITYINTIPTDEPLESMYLELDI